jgi:hypothetical protein
MSLNEIEEGALNSAITQWKNSEVSEIRPYYINYD